MDVEILDALAEFHQDATGARLDQLVDGDAIGDDTVDLVGFEGRDLGSGGAERGDVDPVGAPAL